MKSILPLISVIVPNYNHEKYLKERLDSIFNQTYPNFEVIVLDDCSTDNSRYILNQYSQHPKASHCVFNEINAGNTFVQWNRGIALARGEFIWIAESDDFCDYNFLEEVSKPLIENDKVVLSYCQSNRVDGKGTVTGNWLNQTSDLDRDLFLRDFVFDGNEFIEKFLIYRNVIPNAAAVIFRKNGLIKNSHLDLNPLLKYNGDWLFYLKIIANNKVAFIEKPLNNFRFHSHSVITSGFDSKPLEFKIEVNICFRECCAYFFKKMNLINFKRIAKINNQFLMEYKYKLGLFYINNNDKVKGVFLMISITDFLVVNFIKRIFK
ncbi:glycosyltransferase family 2 protein [Flavobacterium aestivum]|uniref:glycosyltransferase family 2 protein n=1 Tax=Flavobacterium aestivum TaxID=3003257 RepID=UPI002482D6F6|nr:glycosyltransferase family 2 protein [Flavobacterium aestivum]